jgi:hypothetical protein
VEVDDDEAVAADEVAEARIEEVEDIVSQVDVRMIHSD